MIRPYTLTPKFKEVLWGGEKLRSLYHKAIPSDMTGESFEASVIPSFESVAEGLPFRELLTMPGMTKDGFHLLFKLIDARKTLSVQVHPNDAQAKRLGDAGGKTECWYILSAAEKAFLYLGFQQGVSKEDFQKALLQGTLEDVLSKVYVHPGEVFYVPAGTVHAIGQGIVLAELQQSSDVTYRVYDYNRTDKFGRKRELHTEKALACASVEPYRAQEKKTLAAGRIQLCRSPYFTMQRVTENGFEATNGNYCLLFIENGRAELLYDGGVLPAKAGDTIFLPMALSGVTVRGECTYLRMDEVKDK